MIVYQALSKTINKSISEILNNKTIFLEKHTGLLKAMAKRNAIIIKGNGKGTKYRIN